MIVTLTNKGLLNANEDLNSLKNIDMKQKNEKRLNEVDNDKNNLI